MYRKLMVPVDLAHTAALQKALTVAADLARHYLCPLCYVGICPTSPNEIAHNPEEFQRYLEEFGQQQAAHHSLNQVSTLVCTSHDPAVELNQILMQAAVDNNFDLVVMASHTPGLADHLFASHAGYLASHSELSVLVVR